MKVHESITLFQKCVFECCDSVSDVYLKGLLFRHGFHQTVQFVLTHLHLIQTTVFFFCFVFLTKDFLWNLFRDIMAHLAYSSRQVAFRTKAPFIWRKVVPARRVTRLPELPWASQLFLHLLTKLGEPFT